MYRRWTNLRDTNRLKSESEPSRLSAVIRVECQPQLIRAGDDRADCGVSVEPGPVVNNEGGGQVMYLHALMKLFMTHIDIWNTLQPQQSPLPSPLGGHTLGADRSTGTWFQPGRVRKVGLLMDLSHACSTLSFSVGAVISHWQSMFGRYLYA